MVETPDAAVQTLTFCDSLLICANYENSHDTCSNPDDSNVIDSLHDYNSYDLHDTITYDNNLSDISYCSSINKSHLVLNDSVSHKNVSFIKSVSNFNGDDQSSLHDVSLSVNTDHGFLLDYDMSMSQTCATESCVPHQNTVYCNDTVGRSLTNSKCHSANSVSSESHNVSSDLSDLSVQSITIYDDFSCSDDISNVSTNYLFSKLSVNSTGKYDGNDCVSFERSVILSDNVSHVNDNHDIDSCIPCIPSIDCDDYVAHSLSDYDKDNNGISFNNDDTNFIDVNHSFQCSLKLSNNEDHVDGQSDKSNNKAKMSHGSNLSVLYFNARSIKNKLEEFHARVYLENPDIIAITESWLDDSFNAGEVFPSEYSVFRNDRNTHGGGVALGIKCYLNPVLRPEFLSSNIEIVWAELTTTRGKCLFGVYYRPPSQNKNGLEILDENLCKIQASNRSYEVYTLVGDFNIHIDWVSDMNVTIKGALPKTLIDTMNSSGFTQVLKEPTYRTLNGADHFLDLVFVSDPSFVIDCSSTYNLNGCDHSAVSLLLNTCHVKSVPSINKPVYCLKRADFDKMKCLLTNGIDQLCFKHDDIDCIWNSVEGVIKQSIDKSVPKKRVSKFKSLAWMNKDIRKMCTRKKLLYKRAKSSGSEVAWQQFKECSNKVKALVRKSHRDYTYGISVNAKYNPKKFWSYISSLRKDCDNVCFTINGTTVSNPSNIADEFNNHFCSKFDGIYKPLDLSSLPDTPTSHGASPLSFDSFSVAEVFDVLKNLDTSKSPGPDDILPIFLKTCSNELAPVLCKVFNFFVQKGQVPKAWKEANVVPVYKGGVKPKDDCW